VANPNFTHVDGDEKGQVLLYALSTCHWCRKTKDYLNEMGVAYDYIDVDALEGAEKEETKDEVKKWNPKCSFPTLVINNECIVGFDQEKIKGALN